MARGLRPLDHCPDASLVEAFCFWFPARPDMLDF